MSIDQPTLARRLREARESSGLTQDEVAQALQLPRTAIVQIEGANRAVSSLELSTLARLYQRRIDAFFNEAEPIQQDETPLTVLYRAGDAIAESPESRAEMSGTIELCRIGMQLDQVLGRKPRLGPPAYAFTVPVKKLEAVEQGVRAAEQERRRLELGDAPIADLAEVISSQEVWTSAATLRDDVSGIFLRHPELGMVILINAEHNKARQRFSYAHEYAHALFDRDNSVTVSAYGNRNDLHEVRANAFAAAFLMSPNGVAAVLRFLNKGTPSRVHALVYDQATEEKTSPAIQAEYRTAPGSQTITCKDVALLAHHFGVSYMAAAYRIRNLSYINQAECENLIAQDEKGRGYLKLMKLTDYEMNDPQPSRELKNQVAYKAIEAYRREEFSRGRMLELGKLLGIPGTELLKLAVDPD
jgi:Zn-dependent peptidase ImmA (M78 family)/transcriptional regulator with XRE-family HTH domain